MRYKYYRMTNTIIRVDLEIKNSAEYIGIYDRKGWRSIRLTGNDNKPCGGWGEITEAKAFEILL